MNLPLKILAAMATVLLPLILGAFWRMKKYERLLHQTKRRVWSPPPPPPPAKPARGYSAQRRRQEAYHHSRRKYARPRAQVEREIARRYYPWASPRRSTETRLPPSRARPRR